MQTGRWLLFFTPALLAGQAVSVDLSPTIPETGRAIALIQLHGQTGAEPAALEWTIGPGTGDGHLEIEPGEQAIAAGKQITCASAKNQATCVLWGPNRNVIHDGIVAKVIVSGDSGAGAGLRLSRVSAASAAGSGIRVDVHPEASRVDEQRTTPFSLLLNGAGIALLILAILGAIYVARTRLTTAR